MARRSGRLRGALQQTAHLAPQGVRVPGDVDIDRIQADIADGVLTLHLPKTAAVTRRTIEIRAEGTRK
ncbi:Hsp20/alpha crystallin family protein [Streptomyces sp. NPDC055400]